MSPPLEWKGRVLVEVSWPSFEFLNWVCLILEKNIKFIYNIVYLIYN